MVHSGAQHTPVFTLGKRGKQGDVLASDEELLRLGVDVHRSPRGGESTYHGPGQVSKHRSLLNG